MQSRIRNIAVIYPDSLKSLLTLAKSVEKGGVPHVTLEMVHLRASQINGCSVCVNMHAQDLKKSDEKDERIFTVSAWREAPFFTEAERAALALTEAVTRISDNPDPVPDVIWNEAAKYYNEEALAELIVHISLINVWNRFNVSTRQPAVSEW